jgi:hypothetical protein
MYLPECPIPLLGRDLLTKLGAQITFNQGGPANLTVRGPNALFMAVTMLQETNGNLPPGKGGHGEAHLAAGGVS